MPQGSCQAQDDAPKFDGSRPVTKTTWNWGLQLWCASQARRFGWPEEENQLVNFSVKWKSSLDVCGWKAFSKWSNLNFWALPHFEPQPTAIILPLAGFPLLSHTYHLNNAVFSDNPIIVKAVIVCRILVSFFLFYLKQFYLLIIF